MHVRTFGVKQQRPWQTDPCEGRTSSSLRGSAACHGSPSRGAAFWPARPAHSRRRRTSCSPAQPEGSLKPRVRESLSRKRSCATPARSADASTRQGWRGVVDLNEAAALRLHSWALSLAEEHIRRLAALRGVGVLPLFLALAWFAHKNMTSWRGAGCGSWQHARSAVTRTRSQC